MKNTHPIFWIIDEVFEGCHIKVDNFEIVVDKYSEEIIKDIDSWQCETKEELIEMLKLNYTED